MTREEAIKILKEIIEEGWLISDFEKCVVIDACEMAIESLEQEPKTGHWIRHSAVEGFKYERTPYECSCCNNFERESSSFCPNCGARMEINE